MCALVTGVRTCALPIYDLFVAQRVHGPVHVNYIVIVETAEYMNNGIGSADITQELIAQAFPFACPFYQAGDINDLNSGWNQSLRIDQICQLTETIVRNGNGTDVGIDGTEREVGRLCLGVGKRVEQSGFTNVG